MVTIFSSTFQVLKYKGKSPGLSRRSGKPAVHSPARYQPNSHTLRWKSDFVPQKSEMSSQSVLPGWNHLHWSYFCYFHQAESLQTDRHRQKHIHRQTDSHRLTDTARQTDRQTQRDRQTDKQTDRQTERQTVRQTDRHRHRHTDRQRDTTDQGHNVVSKVSCQVRWDKASEAVESHSGIIDVLTTQVLHSRTSSTSQSVSQSVSYHSDLITADNGTKQSQCSQKPGF